MYLSEHGMLEILGLYVPLFGLCLYIPHIICTCRYIYPIYICPYIHADHAYIQCIPYIHTYTTYKDEKAIGNFDSKVLNDHMKESSIKKMLSWAILVRKNQVQALWELCIPWLCRMCGKQDVVVHLITLLSLMLNQFEACGDSLTWRLGWCYH